MRTIGRCWMAALGLALMTAACGSDGTADAGEDAAPIKRTPTPRNEFIPMDLEATIDNLVAEINRSSIEPMQMTVILKTLSEFFAPIATGANRAMGEIGATGNVVGSFADTDDQQKKEELQSQQIENTVMEGSEGIGISPFGARNAAAIDEAVAKGVHVVTLDTDLPASKRSIYVGTINESAGTTAGETLLEFLPQGPGTVIIHGHLDPSWDDGLKRTQGAQRVLEEAGYTPLVRQVTWLYERADEDIEWMRAQIEAAEPPVVGLIGMFNVSYWCATAVERANRPDLPVVAFDFSPNTVDYMRKGLIKATHVQRQYYQGYLVPYVLYGLKTIGLDVTKAILAPQMVDDSRFDLGLDVVPGHKVDDYITFLDLIGTNQ
ncbi:substrate-binding domain-containing protein [Sorangium sp. So ce1036]|uniref:substrate-binding domain-containing protein n=1 Tax=Sorangium sp. So ce1036 TaxID=3133328 RepID=UPI003F12BA0E